MKYLVALLLVLVLIAEYEQRIKVRAKYRDGIWRIKVRDGWFTRAQKYELAAYPAPLLRNVSGRNVDHIDEDLDKRESAILKSGLQSLLQQVVEKREKAGDTSDTEYV